MKKTLLLALLFVGNYGFSQGYKQDINVELLTDIISKKQDEIRKVVMQNTLKKASKVTNLATANTTINIANTLLVEKNKVLMKRRILQELTLYSFSYYYKELVLKKYSTEYDKSNLNTLVNTKDLDKSSSYDYKTPTKNDLKNNDFKNSYNKELLDAYFLDTIYNYFVSKLNENNLKKYFPNFSEHKNFMTSNDFEYEIPEEEKNKINTHLKIYFSNIDSIITNADSTFTKELKQILTLDLSNLNFSDLSVEKIDCLINLINPVIAKIDDIVFQNNIIKEYYNIILKYIIIDEKPNEINEKYYTIDVEAIILELENSIFNNRTYGIDKYCVGFQPFFNIGLNYGWFTSSVNEFNFDNSLTSLSSMAWAGEKIGVKIIFADWKYTRSKLPNEWYSYRGINRKWNYSQKELFINKFYLNIYGSGILYNIANLKTEDKFDYAIAGTHLGVEMFNGLDISIGYAVPFIKGYNARETFNNGFVNLSFDVPIFEYIREARKD